MHMRKRKVLEADGWKIGTAQEFLCLSDEETESIDVKLALGRAAKAQRFRLLEGLARGEKAAEEGRTLSHAVVKKRMARRLR